MKNLQYLKLKKATFDLILPDKAKEYYCHIQFVTKIALRLAEQFKADNQVIELASLMHDVGRGKEKDDETHEETSGRIASQIIQELTPDLLEKGIIVNCVKHHNNKFPVTTVEEKILISADGASKVLYHQAFMLMCKKENFIDRATWGKEYLEKGMKNILFTSLKEEINSCYQSYLTIYKEVLKSK